MTGIAFGPNLIQVILLHVLLWLLTHEIRLQRAVAIKQPEELEIVGHRVAHAVLGLVAVGALSIIRLIVCPIELSNRFSIRKEKELSFAAQVGAARPKLLGAFEFKVFERNKNVKRDYAMSRKRSHLCC